MKWMAVCLLALVSCNDWQGGNCDYCNAHRDSVDKIVCTQCKSYHVACRQERQITEIAEHGVWVIKFCPKKPDSK